MPIALFALWVPLFAAISVGAVPPHAETQQVRPYLVALSVAALDRSIAFYGTHFGFRLVERTLFREHGMELAFLDRDGFRIELVALAKSQPRVSPDPANDAALRGLVKIGFAVDDVDALVARLRAAGVPIEVAPFDDKARGFRGGIVRDPDGNMIGLYQHRS